MPPGGKPQLSTAQLAVLNWWLATGAKTDATTLGELKPAPEMLRKIQAAAPTGASRPSEAR
jgi:hypothetical protein